MGFHLLLLGYLKAGGKDRTRSKGFWAEASENVAQNIFLAKGSVLNLSIRGSRDCKFKGSCEVLLFHGEGAGLESRKL